MQNKNVPNWDCIFQHPVDLSFRVAKVFKHNLSMILIQVWKCECTFHVDDKPRTETI